MKTTLEISDPLLEQLRKIAAGDGETLCSLVEQGLRKVVAEGSAEGKPFKLCDGSFGAPGGPFPHGALSWEEKRALIYEGRGE
jgi:hypothetical protein